jgi:hypothetical protein
MIHLAVNRSRKFDVGHSGHNSHRSTCERGRRVRDFQDPKRTQTFLLGSGPIRQRFALERHLICASPRLAPSKLTKALLNVLMASRM